MKFDPAHAMDCAVPTAVLLCEQFFPLETGRSKRRLIKLLADYLATTILAYCEFAPPQPVPAPSNN